MSFIINSCLMETIEKPTLIKIVPKRVLKGKDGRDPIAEKAEEARKFLEKHPLPDFITKR
jgi:hypothetical protein